MQRKKAQNHNKERWLISYADLMTLLFAFFTTLYAISTLDAKKAASLSDAMKGAFHSAPPSSQGVLPDNTGILPASDEVDLLDAQKSSLAEEMRHFATLQLDDLVEVREEARGVVLSLAEAAFFTSGSAQLRPEAQVLLDTIAQELKSKDLTFLLEGHTDDVPIRSAKFYSNWELSTARAIAVVRFFIERHHFAPERLSAAGYGPYHPISDNQTAAGRTKNRRVDLVLQPKIITKEKP